MSFNKDWDITKYRSKHESYDQWKLKQDFLLKYKHKYPEAKLVSLAQMFYNIEWFGCQYSSKTMKLIQDLTRDLAYEHRRTKQHNIKRTLVSASSAAKRNIKGLYWDNNDEDAYDKMFLFPEEDVESRSASPYSNASNEYVQKVVCSDNSSAIDIKDQRSVSRKFCDGMVTIHNEYATDYQEIRDNFARRNDREFRDVYHRNAEDYGNISRYDGEDIRFCDDDRYRSTQEYNKDYTRKKNEDSNSVLHGEESRFHDNKWYKSTQEYDKDYIKIKDEDDNAVSYDNFKAGRENYSEYYKRPVNEMRCSTDRQPSQFNDDIDLIDNFENRFNKEKQSSKFVDKMRNTDDIKYIEKDKSESLYTRRTNNEQYPQRNHLQDQYNVPEENVIPSCSNDNRLLRNDERWNQHSDFNEDEPNTGERFVFTPQNKTNTESDGQRNNHFNPSFNCISNAPYNTNYNSSVNYTLNQSYNPRMCRPPSPSANAYQKNMNNTNNFGGPQNAFQKNATMQNTHSSVNNKIFSLESIKSCTEPYGLLVVYLFEDEHSLNMLTKTANFFKKNITSKFFPVPDGWKCQISLNNFVISEATSENKKLSRSLASDAGIEELRKHYYTLQMKNFIYGRGMIVNAQGDLVRRTDKLSKGGRAAQAAKQSNFDTSKLNVPEGVYLGNAVPTVVGRVQGTDELSKDGKAHQGTENQSNIDTDNFNTSLLNVPEGVYLGNAVPFVIKKGKRTSKHKNAKGKKPAPWQTGDIDLEKMKKLILNYKDDKWNYDDLVFSTEFPTKMRETLLKFALTNGLSAKCYGSNMARHLVVSKKNDIWGIINYLIATNNSENRNCNYRLLFPGEPLTM